MNRRNKKISFVVAGLGRRAVFQARHAAGAVAQFRRRFHLPSKPGQARSFRPDPDTGGWIGIAVGPIRD